MMLNATLIMVFVTGDPLTPTSVMSLPGLTLPKKLPMKSAESKEVQEARQRLKAIETVLATTEEKIKALEARHGRAPSRRSLPAMRARRRWTATTFEWWSRNSCGPRWNGAHQFLTALRSQRAEIQKALKK